MPGGQSYIESLLGQATALFIWAPPGSASLLGQATALFIWATPGSASLLRLATALFIWAPPGSASAGSGYSPVHLGPSWVCLTRSPSHP